MARFHVQPLLLLLVSSLFFLPTLRGIKVAFKDCGYERSYANVSSVDLVRDENKVDLKISGYTSEIITEAAMLLRVTVNEWPVIIKTYNLCELMECPITPGAFVLSFDKRLPFDSLVKSGVQLLVMNSKSEIICLEFDYQFLELSRAPTVISLPSQSSTKE